MSELVLYTSNENKVKQAGREFPEITALKSCFDEQEIKKAIDPNLLKHPLEYPLRISQEKFQRTLDALSEEEKAIIPVVSDSVIAVKDEDGNLMVLNRDEDNNNLKKATEGITKRTGTIYFIGAVTFGVEQPYSILSYCKINLKPNCYFSLPLVIDSLPQITDSQKGFEVGYLDNDFQERQVFNTFNFDSSDESQGRKARPFISGLTREVLEIAEQLGNFEANVSKRLKDLISGYPFNTLSFYALTRGFNKYQLRSFYRRLFDTDFFDIHGGNCSLFTNHLGKKLEELGYQVSMAIFPSTDPDKEDGHSGVLVRLTDKLNILLDPGLSIPFSFPLSEIPLHYSINYGNGKNAKLRFNEKGDLVLVISSSKKEKIFPARELISLMEFKERAPEILLDLHSKRKKVKIDYHDEDGKQQIRIILNLDERTLIINGQSVAKPEAAKEILQKLLLPSYLIEHICSLLVN